MLEFLETLDKSKTSLVISDNKYDQILKHLSEVSGKGNLHFKAWAKKCAFWMVSLSGLGIERALVVPNTKRYICLLHLSIICLFIFSWKIL